MNGNRKKQQRKNRGQDSHSIHNKFYSHFFRTTMIGYRKRLVLLKNELQTLDIATLTFFFATMNLLLATISLPYANRIIHVSSRYKKGIVETQSMCRV